MNRSKAVFFSVILLAFFMTGWFFVFQNKKAEAPVLSKSENLTEIIKIVPEARKDDQVVIEKKEVALEAKIPPRILIAVPFTTQAPFSVWDQYHEETCEEASLLMVQYFLQKKPLTKEIAERELQKMIAFQIKNYGDYMDSTAEELVKLAADFYDLKKLKVVYDFSSEDLKKELAKGNPVIVPAAGRLLGNPNFTAPGPLYHALVLVGYDGDTIITNDPGTRKGEGYRYDIDVLFNAIHDFPGDKNKIETGRKAMIVIAN